MVYNYALGKAHMRSTASLRSFPNVAFETVPTFVCLTMALSRPVKEDRLALPLSNPQIQADPSKQIQADHAIKLPRIYS